MPGAERGRMVLFRFRTSQLIQEVTSGRSVHLSSMERNDVIAALDREIAQLEQVRRLLGDTPAETPKKRGRPKGSATKTGAKPSSTKSGMSAAAREKISAAQKARWARAAR